MLSVLGDLLLDLELDSEMRRIKGNSFEKTVAERIQKDVPGIELPMKPCLRLKRKGSRKIFAEADLYIASGPFLIIVDCKSYSVTREYLKGVNRAVGRRWELVQQWMRESDDRAKLIAEVTDPANYRIPPGTTHIIPLVCSAFPECIWGVDERWYLTSEIPLVCTYAELVHFVRDAGSMQLSDRSFAIPISPS